MEDKEKVNGTEESISVENTPEARENSPKMVEEKSEDEQLVENNKKQIDEKGKLQQKEIKDAKPIEEAQESEKDDIESDKIISEVPSSKEEKEQPSQEEAQESKKEELESSKENSEAAKEVEPSIGEKGGTEEIKDEHHSHEDDLANEDFSTYSKDKIVELVKKLAKHNDPLYAERYLKQIEPKFEELKKAEIKEAKEVYKKENGNEDGFSFNSDELTSRFYANSRLIHDHRHTFLKDRDAQRQLNLVKAEEALEKLRGFVDSEESSISFNKFKEIQKEWKAIGDVPGNQSKTLWANYNALINRFYDQRSIYFELKELDRKKNYESKVKICERAEALENFENLKEAINTLNDLHDEYKHLGPVPQELQEDLWSRFKLASDKVYQKRKEFVSDLKVVLLDNLKKKEELVAEIKLFIEFDSDRIKAWNAKTKDLLELQKKWETIGGLPREKSKEINKSFWSSFKIFFHNKSNFFKKLDEERKGNYEAKLILVEKAEALKENTDWFKTANDFKALQLEWKEIGPVPEKVRNEVYEKFKTACDFFFNNKRSSSKDEEKNFKENLKNKKDIIAQFISWSKEPDAHIEDFKTKAKEFAAIGFVPRKDINSIKEKFTESANKFIDALTSEEEVKNALRMEIELGDILGSRNSEQAIYGKEQNLRKQIQHLENDVALWRNNLEFFAHSKSKNADDLRKDVNQKIEKGEAKILSMKGQLKVLRSI